MKLKSGRELHGNLDIFGLMPSEERYDYPAINGFVLTEGYDGFCERRELAEEMISRWKKWAGMGEK